MFSQLQKDLEKLANPQKAKVLARFFKTGKGEYGEGDQFLGVIVPKQRQLVEKYYQDLSLADLQKLLQTKIHEYRLTALLILVKQYKKAQGEEKKKIFAFYLKNTKNINNWDLIDLTAPQIVGESLAETGREVLYQLAKSDDLWERRIAIMSTFAFIRNNDFADTLKIAEILLTDKHDLIHKAVGWMLREIGKRDQKREELFLKKHSKMMPRTMLRYAIEKFSQKKRESYLAS